MVIVLHETKALSSSHFMDPGIIILFAAVAVITLVFTSIFS